MNKSLKEIAQLVGGTVVGDETIAITGFGGIENSGEGDLTFLSDARYSSYLASTEAAAVLVPLNTPAGAKPSIEVDNPYQAFATLLHEYQSEVLRHPRGIHPLAVIAEGVELGEDVHIDAKAVLAEGCRIGDRVVLYAGVYVGRDSVIGAETLVYPNVVIRERVTLGARCIIHANSTIGADGFGFVPHDGAHVKIPQVGTVRIGDDVEVGANTAIDRAMVGETVIGRGTKIDNLVQIGHNVHVGEFCTISGGTGIGGSVVIGNHVTIAGQVGIGNHLKIGDGAIVGGRSGVTQDIAAHTIVAGFPANEVRKTRRSWVGVKKLPEALRTLRRLEQRVGKLEDSRDG